MMIIASIVGPLIIRTFFDEWSTESFLPFQVLLVGMAAGGANGVFSGYNHGQGQPQRTAFAVAVGLAVTIALDLLLIPWWGIVGAAVASSCAYTVTALALGLLYVTGGRRVRSEAGARAGSK